ncbi:hypothetical protein BCR44DRAFT_1441933 [Catenaria anguillulae PL171]|uniref:Uncharacterized protein n=1 Tax=Catenaria anguillulae PL171 TaxID=765915 RepID=A0A1Y2HCK1_9FUNG|nr:hypothetical protein BCR44DRAFT_1441933 [Catenaria anguillulae PL171]
MGNIFIPRRANPGDDSTPRDRRSGSVRGTSTSSLTIVACIAVIYLLQVVLAPPVVAATAAQVVWEPEADRFAANKRNIGQLQDASKVTAKLQMAGAKFGWR